LFSYHFVSIVFVSRQEMTAQAASKSHHLSHLIPSHSHLPAKKNTISHIYLAITAMVVD
jgi:hypothetical protein